MERTLMWYRVQQVALAPPPLRCVVVALWHEEGKDGLSWFHQLLPVLAIETVVRHAYRKTVEVDRFRGPRPGTHPEFLRAGWHYDGQEVVRGLVVHHFGECDELKNIEADDSNYHHPLGSNCRHRLVVCDWPPSEDEHRLRPVLDEMVEQLRADREQSTVGRCEEC